MWGNFIKIFQRKKIHQSLQNNFFLIEIFKFWIRLSNSNQTDMEILKKNIHSAKFKFRVSIYSITRMIKHISFIFSTVLYHEIELIRSLARRYWRSWFARIVLALWPKINGTNEHRPNIICDWRYLLKRWRHSYSCWKYANIQKILKSHQCCFPKLWMNINIFMPSKTKKPI